ncbi:3-methyl-2-oxobutanoate hydroxymethyltransferase [Saliniramus sp.]|uniref:3-methyl-2-oxobutanoate hydroxymethyltransferase n=1 Tax=Saliniramus sp. TaxID=2986772 RepID=UPI002BADAE4B|nr:3-methyl-2-oxobutanoate hydroxymethyltransferase [Saliniramus sp.]HMB10257.1 3-methyl-2-oxobutanoate hydroxymethyltransferase [Saliniramus sp.]
MSAQSASRRLTAPDIAARKGGRDATPIVALTAYTAPMARLVDHVADVILVGDSVGMVVHGYDSTLPVTVDMMILHAQAVMRASTRALVVVDLPFAAYEAGPVQAFEAAARIMKETGCGAVKLEGGAHMAETVRFISQRGIPVMGHTGLTPQAIASLGSFRAQGRERAQWPQMIADAQAIAGAGAFSVVVEAVAEPLAVEITKAVHVPVIGIGASPQCDGQILVLDDMLGLTARTPKFVKRYAEIGAQAERALADYAQEVRERRFPSPQQTYPERQG